MKKLYFPKRAVIALAVLAVLAVGCGLKIRTVTFSAHEVDPGETLSMTIDLTNESNNDQDDYYLLYAVRVPADWTATSLTVTNGEAEAPVEMKECEAYGTFAQWCFPAAEGYKWVGFQSVETNRQANSMSATVQLVAGHTPGDYRIDVLAGGWKFEPYLLLDNNGKVIVDVACGNNKDFTDNVCDNAKAHFHPSEYITNIGTIPQDEYDSRFHPDETSTITLRAVTLPLELEIVNLTNDQDMSVKVRGEEGAIEGIAVDVNEDAAEYFDFQGRKVANPGAGIYLVKRGSKISKEVIR